MPVVRRTCLPRLFIHPSSLWSTTSTCPEILIHLSSYLSSTMAPTLPDLSFKQSLALTALVASLATTTTILSFQALRREHRTEKLKREVGEDVEKWELSHSGETTPGTPFTAPEGDVSSVEKALRAVAPEKREKSWKKGEFDESLIREQVSRAATSQG